MTELQDLCATGQRLLMEMEYLQAEEMLVHAEALALKEQDYDALARLYMPLQEARRQRRQRCGEGTIRLDLLAANEKQVPTAEPTADRYKQGQFIIAGWGSIQPALDLRRLARERGLYAEAFLAAVYPMHSGKVIVLIPTEEAVLPKPEPMPIDLLLRRLPAHSLVLGEQQIPSPTYSHVMNLWEQLHSPFLAAAVLEHDPLRKIAAYRKTIQVDYACELAHQNLAQTARQLAKNGSEP
jgi:hypothetical protein